MPSPIVAYQNASGLLGNQNFSGDLGMHFTVNTPITIYSLGVFDDGQANMATPLILAAPTAAINHAGSRCSNVCHPGEA